ncbi:efflux RND transporter periplasmic adaptor subunit [Emcibacter sp. SYSU 3D8]|uniref:efflux RND transporter periplasmic adaptor subunit n=1 Tax=Emcibacter sp. SYSU 3D8 TaxID=3133969 RepID=UPI0031FE52EE
MSATRYRQQRQPGFPSLRRIALACMLPLWLAACGAEGETSGAPPPPPVSVAKPLVRETVEWDEYTGRFQATEDVDVRARVSGYLSSINFADGETVKKGALLFVIDQRPFRIAVDRAQAELVSAKSQLDLAGRDLERAEALFSRGNISERVLDERRQAKRSGEAAVTVAESAVRDARLNLEFTEVRAPVAGRVSRYQVSVGNLISGGTAESTLLTTIVSLDPIHFYFDADEAAYLKYTRLSSEGSRPSSRDAPNEVAVALQDEDGFPHKGHMDFVDNRVDRSTGTVQARAVFANPDNVLLPGMFGRLKLIGSGRYNAVLLPDSSIGSDQSRKFVYVVARDNTVAYRPVELGPLSDGLRIVRSGVGKDDLVIVSGLQRTRPGGKVTPQPVAIDKLGAAAAGGT